MMSSITNFPKSSYTIDPSRLCLEYLNARESVRRLSEVRSAWAMLVGGFAGGTFIIFNNEAWLMGVILWITVTWLVHRLERWDESKARSQSQVDKSLISLMSFLEKLPYHYETACVLSRYYAGRYVDKKEWALIDQAVGFLQSRLDAERAAQKSERYNGEVINLFESCRKK